MPDSVDRPRPLLTYDGRIGDLYRIFLVNLLLMIVTLGIWRFWAITRTRRYLWSRTSSAGSRFEYDGTGGQLFVGFLLAVLILFGLAALAGVLTLVLKQAPTPVRFVPVGLLELGFIVLALGAPFSAQRYRLSHTVWRGIRGGMQGSMLAYGLRSLLYLFLMVVSFYQLAPWASLRLTERLINASAFGDQRFTCRGKAGRLYVRFLLTFLAVIVLGAAVFGVTAFFGSGAFSALTHVVPDQPMDSREVDRLLLVLLPAYLVFFLGASIISASYSAAFFRHVADHSTLGPVSFSSRVSTAAVVRLVLGNTALLLFTLGFGIPVVTHRNARYFTTNLLASGALELASLGQNPQPASRFGEGMFQALDAGTGMT